MRKKLKKKREQVTMEEEKIIFCKSGGCTAKLGAGVLERHVSGLVRHGALELHGRLP